MDKSNTDLLLKEIKEISLNLKTLNETLQKAIISITNELSGIKKEISNL